MDEIDLSEDMRQLGLSNPLKFIPARNRLNTALDEYRTRGWLQVAFRDGGQQDFLIHAEVRAEGRGIMVRNNQGGGFRNLFPDQVRQMVLVPYVPGVDF